MATLKPELKVILDKYGINPRDTSQVWDCHGTLVLYHKAYEVIAAKEGIAFDPPQIIEANGAAKLAAICVTGRIAGRAEWSIGEASELNYRTSGKQAPYPWAMAEKRAKDRVVAKLVGLAQYIYSEDEADEFKSGDRKPAEDAPAPSPTPKANGTPVPANGQRKQSIEEYVKEEAAAILAGIRAPDTVDKLDLYMDETMIRRQKLPDVTQAFLSKTYAQRREAMIGVT